MASAEKIRLRIRQIASRPRNVTLGDIEWVMNQLRDFEDITVVGNEHRKAWTIRDETFGVCTHHRGVKQIKPAYVKSFLNAMINTGWYE
jgi:hypothetical protein